MNAADESHDPTPTIEDYLKAIHALEPEDGSVRPAAIANAVGVTRPTVSVTLRRLEKAGWVERAGKRVRLTDAGRTRASSVIRRRDVAQAFLERMLGLPRETAMAEACRLEHALSPRVADALARHLGLEGTAEATPSCREPT